MPKINELNKGKMIYNITDLWGIDIEEFRKDISEGNEFEITFPLSSIGSTQSPLDIIYDYLEVSFCCERISQYIYVINAGFIVKKYNKLNFNIRCRAVDIDNLINDLLYFSEMLGNEFIKYDEDDKISFVEEVYEYEETLNKRIFSFPDLINDYWANLINGAYWEIAAEYYESESKFFNKTYRKYPEHRYGFWKSALSKQFKEIIYFSTENWIIPPKTNLIDALKTYSGIENKLTIQDADKIEYNGSTILISDTTAVYFTQRGQLIHSIKCTERVLANKENKNNVTSYEDNMQINLFGESVKMRKLNRRNKYNDNISIDETKLKYQVSEFGDVTIISHNEFSYVFFSNKILTFEEIKNLNAFLHPAYSKTQNIINLSISGKCNWLELNDDTFEELCYDILYCHPYFDSTTIQKMGKSRSRDGGRDIVIKSKKNPTKEQELYVFQCKYYTDATSLSASKVSNAGNVIMQYGAKGYGVFTTTVIDSTLYDMLDGFNRNMNIDTSFCWSKYELERHINTHQIIKNKYFKK